MFTLREARTRNQSYVSGVGLHAKPNQWHRLT